MEIGSGSTCVLAVVTACALPVLTREEADYYMAREISGRSASRQESVSRSQRPRVVRRGVESDRSRQANDTRVPAGTSLEEGRSREMTERTRQDDMDMHSHSHPHGSGDSAATNDALGGHGMLVVGTSTSFFSHLPMFMAPHDFQVIFEGTFSAPGSDPQRIYKEDRKAHPQTHVYTFNPVEFVMTDLVPPAP